jgi:hypothetical protein
MNKINKLPPPGNDRFEPLTDEQFGIYNELLWKNFIVHNISEEDLRKYSAGPRWYCIKCPCECVEYIADGYLARITKKNADGTFDAIISTRDNCNELSLAEKTLVNLEKLQGIQRELRRKYSFRVEISQRDDYEKLVKERDELWEKCFDTKIKGKKKEDTPVKFEMKKIDNNRLVKALLGKEFIDESETNKLLLWFKGIKPDEPIIINKEANHFISIIADLKDGKYIKNSAKFCYQYIYDSFKFGGKHTTINYISQVWRPSSGKRVKYFNLKDFEY